MATNKFEYSPSTVESTTEAILEAQSLLPGADLSALSINTRETKANAKTLLYSVNTPSYLALTAFYEVAGSNGQLWVYAGRDDGYPLVMNCLFSGGECKVPIPTMLYSPNGWSIYCQGDATNYMRIGFQVSRVGGASSQILYPGQDTYINEALPTTNYGSAATIQLRDTGAGSDCRSLMKFDLSVIGTGKTINMASLSLKSNSTRLVTDWRINAMLTDWTDSQATWQVRKTGINWGADGCQSGVDFRTIPEWQGNISIAQNVRYSFDITNVVREWYEGSIPNYGILLWFGTVDGLNVVTPYSVQAAAQADRPILSVSVSG